MAYPKEIQGLSQEAIDKIAYTGRHRLAFEKTMYRLITGKRDVMCGMYLTYNDMERRVMWHDADKVYLLLQGIDPAVASAVHKEHARHHIRDDKDCTKNDFIEAVIDYECAALTKPDKPENAWDTIAKRPGRWQADMQEICKAIGIDRSYRLKPDISILHESRDYILNHTVMYGVWWGEANEREAKKLLTAAREEQEKRKAS